MLRKNLPHIWEGDTAEPLRVGDSQNLEVIPTALGGGFFIPGRGNSIFINLFFFKDGTVIQYCV